MSSNSETIKLKISIPASELQKMLSDSKPVKIMSKFLKDGHVSSSGEKLVSEFMKNSIAQEKVRPVLYHDFITQTRYNKQTPTLVGDGFEEKDMSRKEFITEAVEHLFSRISKRGINTCYYQGVFGMKELSKYSLVDRELYRMSEYICPNNYSFFTEDLYCQAVLEYRLREFFRYAFRLYYLYGKISDEAKMEVWKWFWLCRFNRIFNENDLQDIVKDSIFDWYESLPNPEFKDIYWRDDFDKIDTFDFGRFKLYDPQDFPLEVLFISHEDGIKYEKSAPRMYPIYDENVLSSLDYIYGYVKFAHRSENFGFIKIKCDKTTPKIYKNRDLFFHKDDFVDKISQNDIKRLAAKRSLVRFKILNYKSYAQNQDKAVRIEVVVDHKNNDEDYMMDPSSQTQGFCDFTISKMSEDKGLANMIARYLNINQ